MKRFAFTLTELMVALGIIGILTAVLFPIILNLMPNQNTIMAKRVFYATQEIVSNLINDDACYPDMTMLDDSVARVGFDDGNGYISCKDYPPKSGSTSYDKFKTLFSGRLGAVADSDGKFTTKDGVFWKLSGGFTDNDPTSYTWLVVDVNGESQGPNCGDTDVTGKCSDDRKGGWDRFNIKIYADGNVEIYDDWAKKAVDINKDITEAEEE